MCTHAHRTARAAHERLDRERSEFTVWFRLSTFSHCSRGAQRVLRYGDMEYVMLHLIFIYLMPGRDNLQRTLHPLFDSRENSSGGPF